MRHIIRIRRNNHGMAFFDCTFYLRDYIFYLFKFSLNDKFFDLFREVNEARPDLDEAFPIFIKNVLEQYNTEYKLLKLKCEARDAREELRLRSLNANLIPERKERRFLWFFRLKPRQNYAQTLMDAEVAKQTEEFFSKLEAELLPASAPDDPAVSTADDEWEIIEEPAPSDPQQDETAISSKGKKVKGG